MPDLVLAIGMCIARGCFFKYLPPCYQAELGGQEANRGHGQVGVEIRVVIRDPAKKKGIRCGRRCRPFFKGGFTHQAILWKQKKHVQATFALTVHAM